MTQVPTTGIRLAELIAALSLATDLGTGQPMEHALRATVLAVHLGDALGLSEAELSDTYYASLLAMVGCTSDSHEFADLVGGDEIAASGWFDRVDMGKPVQVMGTFLRNVGAGQAPLRRAGMVAHAVSRMPAMMASARSHCEVAERIAGRVGFGPSLQPCLNQVFERWDGRGRPNGVKGEDLALPIRVGHLAKYAEIFYRLDGPDAAVAMARERAGGHYDPQVVEVFCREAPRLFSRLEDGSPWELALADEPGRTLVLSDEQLDLGVRAIADFTDLKEPHLAGHSSGVGDLAAAAAERCGLPRADVTAVRRAGYLHDVGRTGVSASIWMKEGRLTEGEWERVRMHPYLTERVLARSKGLAPLGALAGLHHERLDGSGYHRNAPAVMLPPTARLLAAADTYHALTEPRPHRPAFAPDAAAEELRREARAGRLDPEAVNAVLAAAGHRVRPTRREWPAGLSDREVEVLRLLARGLSTREIATTLVLSGKTVDHHIQHIYTKIGVSTRAAAALFAMQHNLLDDVPAPAVA